MAVGYFSTGQRTAPAREGGVGAGGGASFRGSLGRAVTTRRGLLLNTSRVAWAPLQGWGEYGGRERKESIERERQEPRGVGLDRTPPTHPLLEHIRRAKLGTRTPASSRSPTGVVVAGRASSAPLRRRGNNSQHPLTLTQLLAVLGTN